MNRWQLTRNRSRIFGYPGLFAYKPASKIHIMGSKASRARTRERAAKPRRSRATLAWLLAILPNGELTGRLFVYEFWMLFLSGFESSRKWTESTAARDLYDSTEETDSQLQWADAIGWYKLHGNVRWFNLTTKHSKQLVIASLVSIGCYCLRECWVCFSFLIDFLGVPRRQFQ